MTALERLNDQVLVTRSDVTTVGPVEIDRVKRMALASPIGRARICAHRSVDDLLHEMLIVLVSGRYVRPHAHRGKSESFHMIEGAITIVLFDDDGKISRLVDLSAEPGNTFYYRLATPLFHSVIAHGKLAVFHETTNGPFNPEDTLFPSWAPDESNPIAATSFYDGLIARVAAYRC